MINAKIIVFENGLYRLESVLQMVVILPIRHFVIIIKKETYLKRGILAIYDL